MIETDDGQLRGDRGALAGDLADDMMWPPLCSIATLAIDKTLVGAGVQITIELTKHCNSTPYVPALRGERLTGTKRLPDARDEMMSTINSGLSEIPEGEEQARH
jgi:hypothetical protein